MSELLFSAFLIGFLGSAHCLGMCGGIAGLLAINTRASSATRIAIPLLYNLGRAVTYSVAGYLFGLLSFAMASVSPVLSIALSMLAAMMMIALGLYIAQWWFGLSKIEALGRLLWNRIEPLARKFLPLHHPSQALAAGFLWGWLPCGLVYSALIWSSSTAEPEQAALLMLAFGFGTFPSMLAASTFTNQLNALKRANWFRRGAGSLLIAFGLFQFAQVAGLTG